MDEGVETRDAENRPKCRDSRTRPHADISQRDPEDAGPRHRRHNRGGMTRLHPNSPDWRPKRASFMGLMQTVDVHAV